MEISKSIRQACDELAEAGMRLDRAYQSKHGVEEAEKAYRVAADRAHQAGLKDGADAETFAEDLTQPEEDPEPVAKAWAENAHPRGDDGKFISAGDMQAAGSDPVQAAKLRERVTDPKERAKLDKEIESGGGKPGKPTEATKVKPATKPKARVISAVIAKSEPAKRVLQAVAAANKIHDAARRVYKKASDEHSALIDSIYPMDNELAKIGVDIRTPEGRADPRAAHRQKFIEEKIRPAAAKNDVAREAYIKAGEAVRAAMIEGLKPPTPQRIKAKVQSEPLSEEEERTYPSGFRPIAPDLMEKASPVLNDSVAFVESICNGINGASVLLGVDAEGRAWAFDKQGSLAAASYVATISKIPPNKYEAQQQTQTAVHELGHIIEFHKPGVEHLANQFVEYRCRGEAAIPLSRAVPGAGYGKHEFGRKDNFEKAFGKDMAYYVGKTYFGGSTEVVSMGLEQMYRDPGEFAKKDPEYFAFMCHILTM